ncbi:hypothetical protein F4801DRAFT_581362 [Xylaria longipes]|nr:hypothetical protein F4801DRAFT_581362 [Xylaria longipes]
MASTPATNLTSVHSHASDSEGASVDSCGSDYADSADRETINKAFQEDGLSGFVDDKIRFDWNTDTGDLLLRVLLTVIHEFF